MVGPAGLVLIGAAALVVFGPKNLPEIGKAAGKTLHEFKKATQGIMDMDEPAKKEEKTEAKIDLDK
ncbi:twin-arginine translocase TatA/TatE family subunit [Falsibacillus pallidus]|uniref:Sec-independent protein translocase protein TatA n=1 Tax=Falsibacillus pallidus TaxID=493781 RepID=A0A370GQ66_9BACI|nr:twin-arginine translocase TatA/TatE family subunit [Falsibacillus pallidus]RDI45460.1 sec-independent protein translocase protein TatA [Falsibacillus pallidus]